MEHSGSAAPGAAENLLAYRREVRKRRWSWRWVRLVLGCHVAGSYAIAGGWAVHQVVLGRPWDMPGRFVAVLPVVSPLVLARAVVGIVLYSGRAWDTAGTVWAGYVVGFGVGMAVGVVGMAWGGWFGGGAREG